MEEQQVKRHIRQRKDGRYQARYLSGIGTDGKAKYRDVYGRTQAEVEHRLDDVGRLYRYSKRETVARVFREGRTAATLEEALAVLKMEFELRGFKQSTRENYLSAVRKFVTALHKENDVQALTLPDAKNFILNQHKVCGISAATCNGYTKGIRCLFVFVLGRPADVNLLPHFRREKRLPSILSKEEVERLIDSFDNPMYRMIAIVMYSSGLRVSEAVNLRVSDIRRDKMLIFVRQGKGSKDRFAVLSERCLRELERYWRALRPKDYFFPSPQSGKAHVTPHAVQNAVRRAAAKTGLAQRVTPHTLRHCFATHLYEANADIFQTMQALGHASLKSTQIYVHLAGLPGVKSPYDA
jgi:site-specific recombinase XerD